MLQAAPQTIQPPDDDGIHLPALGVCDQAVQGGTAILRARHPFVDELLGGPAACGHVFPFNDRLLLGLKGTMSEAEPALSSTAEPRSTPPNPTDWQQGVLDSTGLTMFTQA